MHDLEVAAQSLDYKGSLIRKRIKIHSYSMFALLSFMLLFLGITAFKLGAGSKKVGVTEIIANIQDNHDVVVVKNGDTIQTILSVYGLPLSNTLKIIDVVRSKTDLVKLKVGQTIMVKYTPESDNKIFRSMTFNLGHSEKITVENVNNNFVLHSAVIATKKEMKTARGVIKDSIISAALAQGVPMKHIMEMINYYSYSVDFQRDIHPNDQFRIVYEQVLSEKTKSIVNGRTLFAELVLSGKPYKMYRFKTAEGYEDFFDEHHASVKRSLLKTPVPASRISSRFGMRTHPILGYSKMHQGVDFAAPVGTPIYAAGRGVVVAIGYKNGYGKYIRLRHNSELETAYAHAQRFATKIRLGSRVDQGDTIAYVGATGGATGPHLHYELIVRGHQTDPLKFKLPAHVQLAGKDLEEFKKVKVHLDQVASN